MPEAVIVATARTPIGRAFKGSLVDARPDDMGGFIVKELLVVVITPLEKQGDMPVRHHASMLAPSEPHIAD